MAGPICSKIEGTRGNSRGEKGKKKEKEREEKYGRTNNRTDG